MNRKPYVYITRKLPEQIVNKIKSFANVGMWEWEDKPVPRSVLLEESRKADALFTMLSDPIDEEIYTDAKKLKVVANLAVGYDNIDINGATRRGIAVCHTPDILTETTADLAFSLIMMVARRLGEAIEYVKKGKWTSWSPLLLAGADVHHKTLGIVGMGKIGEAVARRASGFQMNVLYNNRHRKLEAEKQLAVEYRPFEALIEESDFVLCLTPLTEETRNLFTYDVFKKMKKTAYFINVGRGRVVVEKDLIRALQEGEIAGAGLDVFENEPIGADHPLLKFPNVVALPHIGSASMETRLAMMDRSVENIKRVLDGKRPISIVNPEIYE
ncbi:2-hydroxyacid dehydrogenase [Fervidibacillus halotolerans]|uniref:D-glycerate dehydrogenase n=1 Tax=Fervidibacillus halotolerans TaxID=2980027 RepID=A0A9E8LY72_9BACI|nr:D-glycerate dehydrogenase [Fervidibacillus halotolerans]WAA11892.1 D-glycerate dehydrogenase [Fervidibacillus halotolerans]